MPSIVNRQSSIVNRQSSNYRVKTITGLSTVLCLTFSLGVQAVNQNYTATFTGSDGSSGTVNFTVDSSVATAGGSIMGSLGCGTAAPVLKGFSLTVTGGSVPSGSQTWNCNHVVKFYCGGPAGAASPCTTMLTFDLNTNGTVTLTSSGPTTASVSWGTGVTGTFGSIGVGSNGAVSASLFSNSKPMIFMEEVK